MKIHQKNFVAAIWLTIFLLLLNACSSGSSTSVFKVGGTVTGLSSNGLILQNNGADDLVVSETTFDFVATLTNATDYDVTVETQPTGQSCDITKGKGTINSASVTDVEVVCRNWRTAEVIGNNADWAKDAQIAIAANGNAIAVWRQDRFENPITSVGIMANTYTAGSGWGVSELFTAGSSNAGLPQVDINKSGNAFAVWHEFGSIWANQYIVGSGWGSAALINTGGANNKSAQIAIDDSGNALAVWRQDVSGNGTTFNIFANRYSAGTGWGSAEAIEIDSVGKSSFDPQISINSSGQAQAVWSQNARIRANRYLPGNGWAMPETIQTEAGSAVVPQVAINDAGNAVAVWRKSDANRSIVWANVYVAGAGWNTAEKIDVADSGNADQPQVGIDASGNAVSTWRQNDGSQFNIYSNRYIAGSGWGAAGLIGNINSEGNPATGSSNVPAIAVDKTGNALTVWEFGDGVRVGIFANRYVAGNGWGIVEQINIDNSGAVPRELFTGDSFNPQVSINETGDAVSVWEQFDGSVMTIQANRFE